MAGSSSHTSQQEYDGIIVQSSLLGVGIPKGWGTNKVGCNMIDYLDFKATKQNTSGKGGGGTTTYNYSATLVLAICQGDIQGISTIYKDSSIITATPGGSKTVNGTTITISAQTPLQAAGLTAQFNGTPNQAPWTYLSSAHSTHALGYQKIAYVAAENYALNSSATSPNFNFEVQFPISSTINGTAIPDALPGAIIADLLPSIPRFPSSGAVGSLTTLNTYCTAQGLWLSPIADGGRQASDLLTEILQASNSDCYYSCGQICFAPYGDTTITANGVTYTPNLTPIYALTWDDIIPNSENEDPIQWDINRTNECYNYVQVTFSDRTQQYADNVATAVDQANINTFGKRQQDPTDLQSICDPNVAATVAQLMVQRSANVRRTCEFKTSELFGLLDPMDLIEVPLRSGGTRLVRITDANEADDGTIDFKAEEVLVGTSHTPEYTRQAALGVPSNFDVSPGDAVPPCIINPPISLTNGAYEVWLTSAGGPEWGGAYVWSSTDGTTYQQVGQITSPGRFGVTTSSMAVESDPDTTTTLGIDLTASGGILTSATDAEADAGATLCAVGTEIIAFSNVTQVGTYTANLGSYIRRGQEGTTIAGQASGSLFMRLDNSVCAVPYTSGTIGKTVYIKLQSYNIYGQALEPLELCEAYTFTAELNGANVGDVSWSDITGIPTVVSNYVSSGGTAVNTSSVGTATQAQVESAVSTAAAVAPMADTTTPTTMSAPTVSTAFKLDATGNPYVVLTATGASTGDSNVAGYQFSITLGTAAAIIIPSTSLSVSWQTVPGVSYSVEVREVKLSGVQGAWSAAATGTTALNTTAPNAPSSLVATGGIGGIILTWTNPTNTDLDHIEIWRNSSSSAYGTLIAKVPQSGLQTTGIFADNTLTTITTEYYWIRAVNTSGLTSAYNSSTGTSATPATVGAGGIANAALSLSNFASGLQPVQYVTSLSLASTGAGALAYLSTNSTLYQWNGSAWVSTVALSNSIVGTQIAAGTITAGNIAAGTITASQIAAGTITGAVIAAGTIVASNLAIQGSNLMRDPCFQDVQLIGGIYGTAAGSWTSVLVQQYSGTTYVSNLGYGVGIGGSNGGWYVDTAGAAASDGVAGCITLNSASTGPISASWGYNNTIYIAYSYWDGTPTNMQRQNLSPIIGGQVYELGATCNNQANQGCVVQVDTYDASASYKGSYSVTFAAGSGLATQTTQFTAPTGAAYARTNIYNLGYNNLSGYMSVGALSLRQAATGTLIVNGTITGTKIAAGTITASNILASTITSAQIAAYTITGSNIAAGTITAGNIAAATITGTQIAAGTITASNLYVTSLSSITANVGTMTSGIIQNSAGNVYFSLTSGLIVRNTGSYQLVEGVNFGASSNLVQWYGSSSTSVSSMTVSNCVFAMDNAGNVYHGGALLTGVQPYTNVATSSTVTCSTTAVAFCTANFPSIPTGGGYWTFSAAFVVGGSSRPWTSGTTCTGTWWIQEDGGAGNTNLLSGSWSATYSVSNGTNFSYSVGNGQNYADTIYTDAMYLITTPVASISTGNVNIKLYCATTISGQTITFNQTGIQATWTPA